MYSIKLMTKYWLIYRSPQPVRGTQSTISHPIPLKSTFYYLRLLLPTSIFPAFPNPPMRATYPIRVIFLDFFAVIEHVVNNTNYKFYIFLRLSNSSYLEFPNIFLSTLFSNTIHLLSESLFTNWWVPFWTVHHTDTNKYLIEYTATPPN